MFDIGTLVGKLELEDSLSPALGRARDSLGRFTKDASAVGPALNSVTVSLSSMGTAATKAGTALSVGVTAPLVAAAGASLLFSTNFEASMTRLVSLAGVSQGELEGVKQHILDLAPAVGIGPQALADAMTKVSSTVSDTGVALNILDMAARLSAAGMGEAVDVAGALTAVINSYGPANITAAHAADILTQTVKDGGAAAKELAPTLANVVPIAAQMGVSFEQVGANIATLTKLGVPAAEAVTQLSAVFTALLKETKQGGEALVSAGYASLQAGSSADQAANAYSNLRAAIKEKGLMEVLTDLSTRFKGNESGLADVFGRIEALRNVMGTAGQQAATYATVLDNVKKSSDGVGQAMNVFNAMQETQVMTWSKVSASLQTVAIRLGDALAPAIKSVLDLATPLISMLGTVVQLFTKLPEPVQAVAIAFTAIVAAVGPLLVIVGSIATGVSALLPLWAALTGSTAAAGVATAATGVAVAGAGAGFVTFLGIIGGAVVVLASVSATVTALYNAWKLYSENQDRAADATRQLALDQENLARINKATGQAFTDLGDAEKYVQEHHVALQAKTIATAEAHAKAAVATKEYTEALKSVVDSISKANTEVSATHGAFEKTSGAMRLTVETAGVLIPLLDKLAESGHALTDAEKNYYNVQTVSRINTLSYQTSLLELKGTRLEDVEVMKAQGLSEAEIARKLDSTTGAVKLYTTELGALRTVTRDVADLEMSTSGHIAERVKVDRERAYQDSLRSFQGTAAEFIKFQDQMARKRDLEDVASHMSSAKSISDRIAEADAAQHEYERMIISGNYFRSDLDKQRETVERLRLAARGMGDEFMSASDKAAAAQKKHNDELDRAMASTKRLKDMLDSWHDMQGNTITSMAVDRYTPQQITAVAAQLHTTASEISGMLANIGSGTLDDILKAGRAAQRRGATQAEIDTWRAMGGQVADAVIAGARSTITSTTAMSPTISTVAAASRPLSVGGGSVGISAAMSDLDRLNAEWNRLNAAQGELYKQGLQNTKAYQDIIDRMEQIRVASGHADIGPLGQWWDGRTSIPQTSTTGPAWSERRPTPASSQPIFGPGSIVMNYPILNDPRAMGELERMLDRTLMSRLETLGLRAPGRG